MRLVVCAIIVLTHSVRLLFSFPRPAFLHGAPTLIATDILRAPQRNHLCRATVRASCAAPLSDGANCTSVSPQTPKYCGSCPGRRCCFPVRTTTTTLPFHCFEDDAWVTRHKDVMTIVRCLCKPKC
ncbi:hypothetical protein HPB48_016450 [Haemaphysalis longicornis]|uniref:Uncharacterized protein n=1 Tax=Haemaphysalis longicornis TaxID=44386 RepID=A0A9J6FEH7_HAELO|nr:hypothetical protein HPB48_016450 [Haemaphysalis longicornis]